MPQTRHDLDVAVLQHSGTAATAKPPWSATATVANAEQATAGSAGPSATSCWARAMCTPGACAALNASIAAGATIALVEDFNPMRVIEEIETTP